MSSKANRNTNGAKLQDEAAISPLISLIVHVKMTRPSLLPRTRAACQDGLNAGWLGAAPGSDISDSCRTPLGWLEGGSVPEHSPAASHGGLESQTAGLEPVACPTKNSASQTTG